MMCHPCKIYIKETLLMNNSLKICITIQEVKLRVPNFTQSKNIIVWIVTLL